jgi:hypothetical protein
VGADIICGVQLGGGRMLEMHGDQRHHASNLGDQKQPEEPTAEASSGGQQNHRNATIGTRVVELVAEWSRLTQKRGRAKVAMNHSTRLGGSARGRRNWPGWGDGARV